MRGWLTSACLLLALAGCDDDDSVGAVDVGVEGDAGVDASVDAGESSSRTLIFTHVEVTAPAKAATLLSNLLNTQIDQGGMLMLFQLDDPAGPEPTPIAGGPGERRAGAETAAVEDDTYAWLVSGECLGADGTTHPCAPQVGRTEAIFEDGHILATLDHLPIYVAGLSAIFPVDEVAADAVLALPDGLLTLRGVITRPSAEETFFRLSAAGAPVALATILDQMNVEPDQQGLDAEGAPVEAYSLEGTVELMEVVQVP